MRNNSPYYLTTYTRAVLSDWQVLAGVIVQHTQLLEDVKKNGDKPPVIPNLLTDQHITDSLNGPYSAFVSQKMRAYAAIGRLKSEHIIQENELFKEGSSNPIESQLSPQFLSSYSLANLNAMQKQLNQLTAQHHSQWVDNHIQWNEAVAQALGNAGISLSEIEYNGLCDDEPISELLDRFIELKLELPKSRSNTDTFDGYLTLKAYLAVQSSLSRNQKSSTPDEVNKVLKSLKSLFNDMEKQQQKLLSTQLGETNNIIGAIMPVLEV